MLKVEFFSWLISRYYKNRQMLYSSTVPPFWKKQNFYSQRWNSHMGVAILIWNWLWNKDWPEADSSMYHLNSSSCLSSMVPIHRTHFKSLLYPLVRLTLRDRQCFFPFLSVHSFATCFYILLIYFRYLSSWCFTVFSFSKSYKLTGNESLVYEIGCDAFVSDLLNTATFNYYLQLLELL